MQNSATATNGPISQGSGAWIQTQMPAPTRATAIASSMRDSRGLTVADKGLASN
jgi:hypothetical protein